MLQIQDGQCGMCTHFGEHDSVHHQDVVQIRVSGKASETLIEECGHPNNERVHLMVTPISSCEGFEPAKMN